MTIVWENNPNRDTNGDLDLGWTVTTASHGPQADGGIPIYKNASSQIHLSKTDASGKPITSQSMQYLTQHEFGHAEGVGHVSGGVMASGKDTVIPPGKQTPDPVDLSSDTSAKTGKSAIHDTKPHKGWGSINLNTQNTPSGKLNIMNFSWNASADYYPGGFSELGVRLGDANPVVSLPTGWDWQFIPDDTSSELLVNGHPGFDLPGDGIGWLTLFADDPSFYATAASGFDFSVASSLDFATLYGLTIFELHPDGNATLYQTVPEPGSLALLLSGIFGIASRRLRMTGILRRRNS